MTERRKPFSIPIKIERIKPGGHGQARSDEVDGRIFIPKSVVAKVAGQVKKGDVRDALVVESELDAGAPFMAIKIEAGQPDNAESPEGSDGSR